MLFCLIKVGCEVNINLFIAKGNSSIDCQQIFQFVGMVAGLLFKLDTVDPDYIAFLDQPVAAYDVRRQIELARSFEGHVTIQTMFLRGTVDGRDVDNTGERYVGPWLDTIREIGPEEVTVYTVARDTPTPGLEKAPAEVLDAIADRVRGLGIPCTVGY